MNGFKLLLMIICCFILFACGNNENVSNEAQNDSERPKNGSSHEKANIKGKIETQDFNDMYSNPKKYKGYQIKFKGQVFTNPESDGSDLYLQVFADPKNTNKNVIVQYSANEKDIEIEDYLEIEGVVQGEFDGENMRGKNINLPLIIAEVIEVTDYTDVMSPTQKSLKIEESKTQHGISFFLEKVELADKQTRVYMKVKNDADHTFSPAVYDAKLIAGSKQYDIEDNYESGLPVIQYDLAPGVESEGVLQFDAIDADTQQFVLQIEGFSDNLQLEFEPFQFEIDLD